MECPACSAIVPPEEIRAARRIARCPSCDVTIELAEIDGELQAVSFREPPAPEGLRIEVDEAPPPTTGGYRNAIRSSGEFRASIRWFSPLILFLTLFAFGWDSFLIFWYGTAFATNGPIIMFVFPLIHVAVGVGITLYVLAGWFNRTTIRIAEGEASCLHGPIPVPFVRSARIRLEEVDMFVVSSKAARGKNNRVSIRWTVDARLRSGKNTPFVTKVNSEEQARFLQRKLERFLI